MNPEELIARAVEARENACAAYSHFKVGAALLASSGKAIRVAILRIPLTA